MTQFESLQNELLIDLFEYLGTIHLLRAFFGLNSRFDQLLSEQFRSYHLDFRHISKDDFDNLCEKHFRSIIDRIVSFNLSDKDETPGLIELFLSRGFNINQMINLRSLTLCEIHSNNKLFDKLNCLTCLVYLNVSQCDISFKIKNEPSIINQIWSLPKLRHCRLDRCYSSEGYFDENTFISTNVEHLSICSATRQIESNDLVYLFSYTPNLQVLSADIQLTNEYENLRIIKTSLTTLNVTFSGEINLLNNLFQNMPCLVRLTIHIIEPKELNGDQWKKIILDNIPKLKVFRFQMFVSLHGFFNTEQQIDSLLDTFRTPFWLSEHQWYVKCDWEEKSRYTTVCGHLYTLPYAFNLYTYTSEGIKRSKWTCLEDKKYWLFNHTHTFDCRSFKDDYSYLYPSCFSNIDKFETYLPVFEKIWSIIPTLDHLTSLNLNIRTNDCQSKLQSILDRSPRLYSLSIFFGTTFFPNIKQLFQITSPSIRRLRINRYCRYLHFDFDHLQCTEFLTTPLVLQCEVLEIRIRSPESILDILNSMKNLRSMTIHLAAASHLQPRITESELIEWTNNHLSTKCWISPYYRDGIPHVLRIWIG